MLAKVAVDSSSLTSLHSDDEAAESHSHNVLLRLLAAHGVVTFASVEDRKQLLLEVRSLRGAVRRLWVTALPELTSVVDVAVAMPLSLAIDDGHTLASTWNGRVRVALASRERALALGLSSGTLSSVDTATGIEVTALEAADASAVFQGLQGLGSCELSGGSHRDAVWEERFRTVAAHTYRLTIVDRYAWSHIVKDKSRGLEWLLERAGHDKDKVVHLITAGDRRSDVEHGLVAMRSRMVNPPVHLSVSFVDDQVFKRSSHARHLRFERFSFSLDRGCASFARQKIGQGTPCQYGDVVTAKRRENELERAIKDPSMRRVVLW